MRLKVANSVDFEDFWCDEKFMSSVDILPLKISLAFCFVLKIINRLDNRNRWRLYRRDRIQFTFKLKASFEPDEEKRVLWRLDVEKIFVGIIQISNRAIFWLFFYWAARMLSCIVFFIFSRGLVINGINNQRKTKSQKIKLKSFGPLGRKKNSKSELRKACNFSKKSDKR